MVVSSPVRLRSDVKDSFSKHSHSMGGTRDASPPPVSTRPPRCRSSEPSVGNLFPFGPPRMDDFDDDDEDFERLIDRVMLNQQRGDKEIMLESLGWEKGFQERQVSQNTDLHSHPLICNLSLSLFRSPDHPMTPITAPSALYDADRNPLRHPTCAPVRMGPPMTSPASCSTPAFLNTSTCYHNPSDRTIPRTLHGHRHSNHLPGTPLRALHSSCTDLQRLRGSTRSAPCPKFSNTSLRTGDANESYHPHLSPLHHSCLSDATFTPMCSYHPHSSGQRISNHCDPRPENHPVFFDSLNPRHNHSDLLTFSASRQVTSTSMISHDDASRHSVALRTHGPAYVPPQHVNDVQEYPSFKVKPYEDDFMSTWSSCSLASDSDQLNQAMRLPHHLHSGYGCATLWSRMKPSALWIKEAILHHYKVFFIGGGLVLLVVICFLLSFHSIMMYHDRVRHLEQFNHATFPHVLVKDKGVPLTLPSVLSEGLSPEIRSDSPYLDSYWPSSSRDGSSLKDNPNYSSFEREFASLFFQLHHWTALEVQNMTTTSVTRIMLTEPFRLNGDTVTNLDQIPAILVQHGPFFRHHSDDVGSLDDDQTRQDLLSETLIPTRIIAENPYERPTFMGMIQRLRTGDWLAR